MGSGPARTLSTDNRVAEPLAPELAERLERVLQVLDQKDESFKQAREDEKHQQVSQAWNNKAKDLVEELRHVGKVIVRQHQMLMDCGIEGAGVTTAPYLEEAAMRFPKMQVKLKGVGAFAECDGHVLAEIDDMQAIDYAWLEKVSIEWLVWVIHNRVD